MSFHASSTMRVFAAERSRVTTLAACRARGLGDRLYINAGSMPRINVAAHPCLQDLQVIGWQQLERIGAGEDVARVLGGRG